MRVRVGRSPGAYSTTTATNDLPGILGIACSKFGVITSPRLCAAAGVATARQAAMMTALIFKAVALLCPPN